MSEFDLLREFRRLMSQLVLLGDGAVMAFDRDSVKGGEKSTQPSGVFVRHERDMPLVIQFQRRWAICRTDDARWKLVGEFQELYALWTVRRKPAETDGTSEEDWIIKDGEGFEAAEVARRFNTTPSRVRRVRSKADRDMEWGKPLDGLIRSANRPEKRERALALAERGCTVRQIAAQVDSSKSTVDRWLKEAA
jgi:hypothetical protein